MQNIAGTGQTAPLPMNLYPSELLNAPVDSPTNYLDLQPGDAIAIGHDGNLDGDEVKAGSVRQ